MGKFVADSRLGTALRSYRKRQRKTQAELAAEAKLAERTVWLMERGQGGIDSFRAALEALDLSLYCRNGAGKTVQELIVTLRRRRALSQEELAELAGVTRPTIGALEREGKGRFSTLERVLTALGAGPYLAEVGHKKAFYTTARNSSVGESWETPEEILLALYQAFKFDLDPCSPRKDGPVKARQRFTAEDDGLTLPWFGRVFVNPPYGRILGSWVEKARTEFDEGRARAVVLLIPARTDTAYWHEHITGSASVWFLRGRLKFSHGRQSAPFPSALIVWGASPEELSTLDAVIPGRRP